MRFDAASVARLERAYAAPAISEQRALTRAALAVRRAERGLEVGCGPGFLASELAHELGPNGRLVGIDSSPEMLVAARRRSDQDGLGDRVVLVQGDAARLPVGSGIVDFVVAVQVYLHVPDVAAALGELARALRPGGRAVVVDTDWDSCVWLTADRQRHRRVMDAWLAHFTHAHLPPRLPGLMRAAGLSVDGVRAIPLVEPRHDPAGFGVGLIGSIQQAASRQGVPADEAEAWAVDLQERAVDGEYFFSLNRYLFVATKP